MKDKIPTNIWFPLYSDKILCGSSNWELSNEEFGIFIKLLALSQKDEGWIRANPDMAYPAQHYLGYNIQPEELERTIRKCCMYGKLLLYGEDGKEIKPTTDRAPFTFPEGTVYINRILRVAKYSEYSLSYGHKRRLTNELTGGGKDIPLRPKTEGK